MRGHFFWRILTVALAALAASGCERKTAGLRPFPLSTDPVVFDDTFGDNVDYQAFLGSKTDAVSIDTAERQSGIASLKVTVPAPGDPTGSYAGGAFVTRIVRDLSGYDALTFWAKASRAITLDVAGLGNDNTGTSRFEARRNAIAVTTAWQKFVVPVPSPQRLAVEGGLFFFAEGPEAGAGFDLWFDDVRFEQLGTITSPRPSMATRTVTGFVGATVSPTFTQTIFSVGGSDVTVGHMSGYFDFASSSPTVANASGGVIRLIGGGMATITASLGGVPATGTVTINSVAPPASAAPTPTEPSSEVISLYSNAYASIPVDTWSATWDQADVTDVLAGGNDAKGYTNLVFAGIEFVTNQVDASAMTHFHLDAFMPSGSFLRVKLVDFGPNRIFGGGDDKEHEVFLDSGTTPAVTPGSWSSLDIPFTSFTNLTTRANVSQMVLSGTSTVFVDNVYFHR